MTTQERAKLLENLGKLLEDDPASIAFRSERPGLVLSEDEQWVPLVFTLRIETRPRRVPSLSELRAM